MPAARYMPRSSVRTVLMPVAFHIVRPFETLRLTNRTSMPIAGSPASSRMVPPIVADFHV
jgi:hypothetical protein